MDLPNTPPPPPPPAAVAPATMGNVSKVERRGFPTLAILIILVLLVVGGLVFVVLTRFLPTLHKSGPVKLTYWGLWENEDVIKPLIAEYQASHPNVQIDYKYQSVNQYRERLQNALSSGQGPDIFKIHNSWVPMFKQDLAPVPAQVYSAAQYEATFYPTVKTDLRLGNNYVAVPLEFDGLAMYINQDLLDKAGKTVPTTWVDFRDTAIALSVCDSDDGKCREGTRVLVSGAAMGTADNVDHWQDIVGELMLQNNVNLNAPLGQSAQDVLDFYTIFDRSDHIWDSTLPDSVTAFAQGKVAMIFAPSWRVFDIKTQAPNLNFKIYPMPQAPIDTSRGEKPVTWSSYWADAVNKTSPNAATAWDFVKFLSSKDSLQKLYTGEVNSGRDFGEPYSRTDMSSLVTNSPYVSAYLDGAPNARSWYLASNTGDGPSGINSRLSTYFTDAINSVNQGGTSADALKALSNGINQVLSQYGIVAAVAPQQ